VLVSDDGSRVALSTLNSRWNTNHVVIHDLANDTITDITPDANQRSFPVEFTSDGAELVFISGASNLAEPPTPIGHLQVYLHNFATQTNELLARDGRIQDADLGKPPPLPWVCEPSSLIARLAPIATCCHQMFLQFRTSM